MRARLLIEFPSGAMDWYRDDDGDIVTFYEDTDAQLWASKYVRIPDAVVTILTEQDMH